MSETDLTVREAYSAMFGFLEECFQRTRSDELGMLLGGMALLPDGGTADSASWRDWERAVAAVRRGDADAGFRLLDTRGH